MEVSETHRQTKGQEVKIILMIGNPIDGYAFRGPFPSYEDATAWAERQRLGADEWHATELQKP